MLCFKFKRCQRTVFQLFAVCLIAVLAIPAVVFADGQSEPAVSDINAKVSVESGHYDDDSSFIGLGSVTIPLGHSFGFQVDGAVGNLDDETLLGGGAHLFTRDPSKYLLGVYASYHDWNSINIWRTAMEAELYLDRFSLTGLAGFESVDVPITSGGLLVLNRDDDHFFGHADVAFYPGDDLKMYVGYRYVNNTSLGAAGFEYLLRGLGAPVSLFAEGNFGESGHDRITGGVKVYFGADRNMSLIRRHRTQDPTNWTPVFPNIQTANVQASNQCSFDRNNPTLDPAGLTCTCPGGERPRRVRAPPRDRGDPPGIGGSFCVVNEPVAACTAAEERTCQGQGGRPVFNTQTNQCDCVA